MPERAAGEVSDGSAGLKDFLLYAMMVQDTVGFQLYKLKL
jgi:hypothetical protein